MSLPTPHLLYVKRRQTGTTGGHGNAAVTYGSPQEWLVHAVAPGASERTGEANAEVSLIRWTVYAPANSFAPGELDRVVVDGEEYEVMAHPADWTRGPWGHPTAGIVVELRRPQGKV